jgi:hypothetical protein
MQALEGEGSLLLTEELASARNVGLQPRWVSGRPERKSCSRNPIGRPGGI